MVDVGIEDPGLLPSLHEVGAHTMPSRSDDALQVGQGLHIPTSQNKCYRVYQTMTTDVGPVIGCMLLRRRSTYSREKDDDANPSVR
ncbi:hypothetical protein LINPERPRIM_LOCUS17635 [Linum perenne]